MEIRSSTKFWKILLTIGVMGHGEYSVRIPNEKWPLHLLLWFFSCSLNQASLLAVSEISRQKPTDFTCNGGLCWGVQVTCRVVVRLAKDGWTALMLVCQNGHYQVAELLLRNNANPKATLECQLH